jgi:hypothetical protein
MSSHILFDDTVLTFKDICFENVYFYVFESDLPFQLKSWEEEV